MYINIYIYCAWACTQFQSFHNMTTYFLYVDSIFHIANILFSFFSDRNSKEKRKNVAQSTTKIYTSYENEHKRNERIIKLSAKFQLNIITIIILKLFIVFGPCAVTCENMSVSISSRQVVFECVYTNSQKTTSKEQTT